jgi:aldehyde dehydrogenase (NAD+)
LLEEEAAMQMLIDGEWVDASDGAVDPICDKGSGELIETAPRGTAGDVARVVAAAQQGKRTVAA